MNKGGIFKKQKIASKARKRTPDSKQRGRLATWRDSSEAEKGETHSRTNEAKKN